MKYCVDCKHYYEGYMSAWCRFNDGDIDLVTGKLRPKFAFRVREDNFKCGKNGIWFEEKESPKKESPKKVSFFKRLFK